MKNSKSTILKATVLVLIVAAVLGIFVIKNGKSAPEGLVYQDNVSASTEAPAAAGTEVAATQAPVEQSDGTVYPLKITSVDIDEIRAYGVPTVIDFGSDSCIPCKAMAPVLETLNTEFQGRAAVQFMDVWKSTIGVEDFPVQVIPTQVFFTAEGKPFVPSEKLAAEITFDMYSLRDTGEHVFTVHQGGITEEQMRMIFAEMGIS